MFSALKRKIYPKRYLSPWIILFVDGVCSVVASSCTLLLMFLLGKWTPMLDEAAIWLGTSMVMSIISFVSFSTYRTMPSAKRASTPASTVASSGLFILSQSALGH